MITSRSLSLDTGGRGNLISLTLSYACLLGGLLTVVLAAYVVVRCYLPLPWSDGWIEIFMGARHEPIPSLHYLWQQHNEHRFLVPRLFLVVDLLGFAATQRFLLASIFVIQLLHTGLLSWAMRVLGRLENNAWRAGTGLAAFCLFCPTQWENLVWGFQTCFVLPPFMATLAMIGLLLYRKNGRRLWIAISIAASGVAAFSLASGLIILPLLLLAAALLGLKRSVVLTYVVAAIAISVMFFHNYTMPPPNSNPFFTIRAPAHLTVYLVTYLGSSWTHDGMATAQFAGFIGLALAAIVVLLTLRSSEPSPASALFLFLLVFCAATAFLTSLGRSMSGYEQAFTSRYQTVALLFWLSLGCLVLIRAGDSSRESRIVVQVIFVIVLLRAAWLAHFTLRDAWEHAFQERAVAAALASGVPDRAQLEWAYKNQAEILALVPYMREQRISIFHDDYEPEMGSVLDASGSVGGEDCRSAVQSISVIGDQEEPSYRIMGWVWDAKREATAREIVSISGSKIVGVGATGDWRPQIRAVNPYLKTSFVGFTAYARPAIRGDVVTLYAVMKREPLHTCEIATIQDGKVQ